MIQIENFIRSVVNKLEKISPLTLIGGFFAKPYREQALLEIDSFAGY